MISLKAIAGRPDRRDHIALKLGNDPEQNLVSPDVGMALEKEDANHVSNPCPQT
jgi:hypothetical protein